jgi:tetratricopeptide (TPR) repeat protein
MFLEHRVNQGTSGRVYPYPFTDGVASVSEDVEYQAVFLENEYLRLMMLPQIGGRIHVGMDKTNGYDFVYRQHVIKPALIGLFGSWISGGVEFNWPQHHRPSTFMPVNYVIERGDDGSATIWLSEHDPMDRMKGMVGICLYPDKAYLEMKAQLYNRTPMVQTFLWWINFAVHVHDQYQVFFPPDVTVVTDHSKRSMAHYPFPRGSYYGIEFGDGAAGDISWPKNIPVPTSYFVWETGDDFFGGYDHKQDAGVIHVANRYIAPGKKMFTWGFGDFGDGWERNLTDADGPYIELMAGVYTDNQPDFSWLQPYETKTFSQFWYPIQAIGPAKKANRRVAVNLEAEAPQAKVGVAVTERFDRARITLSSGEQVLLEQTLDLAPGAPFVSQAELPAGVGETDLLLRVCDSAGGELIRYAPQVVQETPLPEAKTPPPPPETFETVEALYLTGLHLEQYRHPTIDPEPYWEAALERDPTDVRCNNAMGLVHLRRGNLEQAEAHFWSAIETLTRRNPNPRDGEPYYNLGLALKWQGRYDEAYAALYKGIWSYAWQAAGYYVLAEIDCLRGDLATAQEHLDRSLLTNVMNLKARNLKAAVLRKGGWYAEAGALVAETVELDPLDMWSRNEMVLLSRAQGKVAEAERQLGELTDLLHTPDWLSEVQAYFDLAFDYAQAGFWDEASDLLYRLVHGDNASASAYPMLYYALGYCEEQLGQQEEARSLYRRASELPTDYCFPVRLFEMVVLQHVQSILPEDARVAYYVGNLYYDKKRYDEAIHNWELSVRIDPGFSIPWRNLGIAYYNVRYDPWEAIRCYEKAVEANPEDGRVCYELQQLLSRTGVPVADRLARLEACLDLVRARDDLSTELAALYNQTGQPQKTLDYVLSRQFHPWEGGTGWVSAQYETAHLMLARAARCGDGAQAPRGGTELPA